MNPLNWLYRQYIINLARLIMWWERRNGRKLDGVLTILVIFVIAAMMIGAAASWVVALIMDQ